MTTPQYQQARPWCANINCEHWSSTARTHCTHSRDHWTVWFCIEFIEDKETDGDDTIIFGTTADTGAGAYEGTY